MKTKRKVKSVINDYGDLYANKDLFNSLFPNFHGYQCEAADIIWKRILGRCGVDIGMPQIEWIIDLGCGEGTLTRQLEKCANKEERPVRIEFIGVDHSSSAIDKARKRVKEKNPRFIWSTCNFNELFERLTTEFGVKWDRTAIICLSHTWFHFDQEQISNAIKSFRPALLVIDVFHSWDDTIIQLSAADKQEVLEFGRPLDDATYWLKTIRSGDSLVRRGLWKVMASGSGWVFSSDQWAFSTEDLFGQDIVLASDKSCEVLSRSRKQGLITGEDKCDYIHRKMIHHVSGWGEMRCHALVSRDAQAALINDVYFTVVRSVARQIMNVEKAADERFSNLGKLLELYNEGPHKVGSREALVILPFDPHTTFARVISVIESKDDSEISKHDCIVEAPSTTQCRFPTAYGIFHTQEDRISSPQAFPLHWAQDYAAVGVDQAFNYLESKMLGLDVQRQSVGGSAPAPSYFLLPVYFGSLPLFTLVLKFPSLFEPENTDFQVYFSTLANLHAEIKVALTDDLIRVGVLRQWITSALDVLSGQITSETTGVFSLEERLDILEKKLFGIKVQSANYETDGVMFAGTPHIGGVLGKNWKSWILSIPSFSIKKLRSVQVENTRLWKLWLQEKELVRHSVEFRLAYWFEEARFFENDDNNGGHEYWLCKLHLSRLHSMFVIAGFQPNEMTSDNDDVWLQKCLENIDSQCNYFCSSHNHFLFKWMVQQLRLIPKAKLPDKCCDAGNCGRHKDVFVNLKAVFCKTLANKGEGVRFGMHRLCCLLDAACGEKHFVKFNGCEERFTFAAAKYDCFEAKFYSREDPSLPFAEFVSALYILGVVAHIDVLFTDFDNPITIMIYLKHKLVNDRGGADMKWTCGTFDNVKMFSTATSVFGVDSLSFSFRVSRAESKSIQFVSER